MFYSGPRIKNNAVIPQKKQPAENANSPLLKYAIIMPYNLKTIFTGNLKR